MVRKATLITIMVFGLSALTLAKGSADSSLQTETPHTTLSFSARYGAIKLESIQPSEIGGVFTARDNGDGTTTLDVQLDHIDEFNPWGIFDLSDCHHGAAVSQRPIFTLPDIENGYKQETVETAAYKSYPGSLSVVVYGIASDGSQSIIACANLGLPASDGTVSQTTPSPTPDCTSPYSVVLEGNWIAVSREVNGNGDIYLVNVDDALQGVQTLKRLTTSPAEDFDPTWSPDSSQLAFRTQRDGNDEIYRMNADGTCQVNITNNSAGDWSPSWSPDGKQIAFAHFFDNSPFTDIAIMNTDGSDLQRLTANQGEYPTWSPDGTHIAFATARDGNYEIYVMNADGTDQKRLTDNPAYDMSPAWSPDGRHIAFDTQRDYVPPVETGIGPEFEIHLMNTDGSGDTRLTHNHDEERFPAWTPDGKIVFSRNGMIWRTNVDGSQPSSLGINGTFPAWRPH